MALIQGSSNILLDVDGPNALAANVVIRRRDVKGAFLVNLYTGTIPAALATNSIMAGIRNGPDSNRRVYITRINVDFQAITAATAAAASSVHIFRYSVASLGQAGALNTTIGLIDRFPLGSPVSHSPIFGATPTIPSTACWPSSWAGPGQLTVMGTTGLSSTGVTIDTNSAMVFALNCTATTPVALEQIQSDSNNELGLEHPIELAPGEGLLFRSQTTFPTGLTGIMNFRIHYFEV